MGLLLIVSNGVAALGGELDWRVALHVAHAGRGPQAPQRGGEPLLGHAHERETELAIERRHARGRRQCSRRRGGGPVGQRHDEGQEQRGGVHATPASCSAVASAREARPRCEIASFSSGESSATVRCSPRGTKSGS